MKKTYNMSETMTRAWAIRKAAAADMGCKVSEVLMGECLKIAWAEAEGANAETNAAAIAGEWANMADADKVRMMTACIRKAAKNEIGYSTEDHYLQFSEVPAFGCFRAHDFDEFVSETCIRVLPIFTTMLKQFLHVPQKFRRLFPRQKSQSVTAK